MNLHAPIDARTYDRRMWWVMAAGCAARFSAERELAAAATGFVFWIAVFAGCWIVRAWALTHSNSTQRLQNAGNAVAMLGLVLFLLRLNTDSLVPALLTFLFAIQAAVFVSATKRLHVWLNLAAALGGVLFAAAESRSPWFLFGAGGFTFAALGLLVLDQRVDRERVMLTSQASATSRRTGGFAFACITLLLAVPLYLFVPKPAGLLWGGMQAQTAHDYREVPDREPRTSPVDEFDESVSDEEGEHADSDVPPPDAQPNANPQQGDYGSEFSADDVQRDRASANSIVLFVKSSHPIYLRGVAYDRFENNRWHRDAQPSRELQLERGNVELPIVYGEERVQQSIEVARELTTTLWHAPGAYRLRFPGPSLRWFEDDVFVLPQNLRADTLYSVESRVTLRQGRYVLAEAKPLMLSRYLNAQAASDRLRSLARSITQQSADPREQALALERHLREQYEYTFETVPQQGYTPLDTFLFETKRGHCEYFASALAMMLRAIDVPSRVVTGFSLGEPNPVTGYYEVRGLDGHAWVEAHIDGGWHMLEPTPFYPLPQPAGQSQVAAQMDRYLDRLAQTNALLEPESLSATASRIARDRWRSSRAALRSVVENVRSRGFTLVLWIVATAAFVAMLYVAVLAIVDALDNRDVRRMLEDARSAERARATLLSAQALEAAGAQRGFERMPSASFREYVEALELRHIAVPIEFAEAFDEARYGASVGSARSTSLDAVNALISEQIESDPRPRIRRALGNWRRTFRELVGPND